MHYVRKFKENAVKLSYQRDNINDLARELGIRSELVYSWRRELKEYVTGSFSGHRVPNLTPEMKERSLIYRFIFNHEHKWTVKMMCRVLMIKRSSYYVWRRRKVIGWSMSNGLSCQETVIPALNMALNQLWYNKKRRHSTLNNLTIDEFWDNFYKSKTNLLNFA